jgi:hypothetical protein
MVVSVFNTEIMSRNCLESVAVINFNTVFSDLVKMRVVYFYTVLSCADENVI